MAKSGLRVKPNSKRSERINMRYVGIKNKTRRLKPGKLGGALFMQIYSKRFLWSNRNQLEKIAVQSGEVQEQSVSANRTCRTIKQVITLSDGTTKEEQITACKGPNGWETIEK